MCSLCDLIEGTASGGVNALKGPPHEHRTRHRHAAPAAPVSRICAGSSSARRDVARRIVDRHRRLRGAPQRAARAADGSRGGETPASRQTRVCAMWLLWCASVRRHWCPLRRPARPGSASRTGNAAEPGTGRRSGDWIRGLQVACCPRRGATRVRARGTSHGCASRGAMWVGPAGGAGSVRARVVNELALTPLPVCARAHGPRFAADAEQEQHPRCVLKFLLHVLVWELALCVQTERNDLQCRSHSPVCLLQDAAKSWVCCNVTLI
jgi:hypothetical protein